MGQIQIQYHGKILDPGSVVYQDDRTIIWLFNAPNAGRMHLDRQHVVLFEDESSPAPEPQAMNEFLAKKWAKLPPSRAQLDYLKSLGAKSIPLNKLEASVMIEELRKETKTTL